jgi:uncharacterized membrane protein YdbT with pleckstrin-like domain
MSEPADVLELRPSLWAAASTFARVASYLGISLLAPVLVAVFLGRSALIASFLLAELSLAAVLPASIFILIPAVRLAFTKYSLDEDGVRVHSDLVSRNDQRVPWEKVTVLQQHRSIVDRLAGIENLDVVAYGARGTTLRLVGLRDVDAVRRLASRRMREAASVEALFRSD